MYSGLLNYKFSVLKLAVRLLYFTFLICTSPRESAFPLNAQIKTLFNKQEHSLPAVEQLNEHTKLCTARVQIIKPISHVVVGARNSALNVEGLQQNVAGPRWGAILSVDTHLCTQACLETLLVGTSAPDA